MSKKQKNRSFTVEDKLRVPGSIEQECWTTGRASDNNQFLLAPATRSRPFGTSALRSRRLPAQAARPPADVRNFER